MEYKIKNIDVNGNNWEYIVAGNGAETFLILPGGGQTAQLNYRLIKEFEKDYKVIAVTIYNCISINQFNIALNRILEKEKITNLTLYGLSLGGLLAQSYLLRNKEKIKDIIISHACTPESRTYFRKNIVPLKILNILLPLLPNALIKFITKHFSARIQTGHITTYKDAFFAEKNENLNKQLVKEFYDNYLNKKLLKTWINLSWDFYKNEKVTYEKLKDWKGNVLILRTDNDPLMQDEGYFNKVYPKATVHTFKNTGHLSFYYQFDEMVRTIRKFLKR